MTPFPKNLQLYTELEPCKNELPGFPGLRLNDNDSLQQHLQAEMCSADLDRLSSKLWMLSDMSSTNISALHRQKVKGRTIIITEDPKLHLVWTDERIFLKPIPTYLLSWNFWNVVFNSTVSPLGESSQYIRRWSLGYLRTYAYLVRHESDFRIAKVEGLLPIDESLTWAKFRAFSRELLSIPDPQVCSRYTYSELRLRRLNFYSRLFLNKPFQRVHHTYGAHFAKFYGPLAFVFGTLSLALNAIQVQTGAAALLGSDSLSTSFWWICLWFSVVVFVMVASFSLGIVFNLIYKLSKEWRYALRNRYRKGGRQRQRANVTDLL